MDQTLVQQYLLEGYKALKRGAKAEAEAAYLKVLANDPNCLRAHVEIAHLRLPGLHYHEILACIHETLRPRTYVEIGVAAGHSISRALPATRCIGVDPSPEIEGQLSPNTTILSMTSDDFFSTCDIYALLGDQSVDLGFVDGMHLYENALADFTNLEKYCTQDSVVMFHDCLPLDAETASRERNTLFWTGDTWRVLPILAHFRPELSITVIGAPPSGLAIVRGLDPASHILNQKWDEVLAYGSRLDFSTTKNLSALGIEMVPSDKDVVSRLFANIPAHHRLPRDN